MLTALAFFALTAPQSTPCAVRTPRAAHRAYDEGRTFLRSGKGLWINGQRYLPGDIFDARAGYDLTGTTSVVVLVLSDNGRAKFAEAQRCRIGQPIEISVNGKLLSAPVLTEKIAGKELSIAGGFDPNSANAYAMELRRSRLVAR